MMIKFSEQEAEYDLKRMKLNANLSHPFALKMAKLICVSVLSAVVFLGMFFGEKTPLVIGAVILIGGVFSLIAFKTTYSACV